MSAAGDDSEVKTYTVTELKQLLDTRTPLPEGVIPAPPEEIAAQIGELMNGDGEGSVEAKEWLETVGYLMSLNVPDAEFHPIRMNKACERIVESLKKQSPLEKEALWSAIQALDAHAAPAKPINITRGEFDRATHYLLQKEFIGNSTAQPNVFELLDSESDPE
eukprot:EC723993.1.p1 GENE.EC723993.1~~EC723993.1.p1  ORF type:complete len:163 (+),score=38.61 EC723993.1:40-528(+)